MYVGSDDEFTTTLDALELNPITVVSETDSLSTVAAAFLRDSVSCAVLAEPPLRVVTEHDLSGAWAYGYDRDDEVAVIATADPCWAPVSASISEAAVLMVSLGVRHLVVLDLSGRPTGIVSMSELFSVLVGAHEPTSLYATFASIMLRSGSDRAGALGPQEISVVTTPRDVSP
ncbi:MAG: CBS domain-containing protein [Acidimicrobiales bacterium]